MPDVHKVTVPRRTTVSHAGELRTTLEVALAARVDVQQVARDVRKGVIGAMRFSRVWMFDHDQYKEALAYYRRRRREERDAAKRAAS